MKVWKPIPNYEEYMVSNTGEIVSNVRYVYSKKLKKAVPHNRQKVLSQYKNKSGYMCVGIGSATKGNRKTMKVHRIVASAFIPNPLNLPEVNHKDGNKENNNANNLEWVTASENVKHAYAMGIQPKSQKRIDLFCNNRKKNDVKVIVTYPNGEKTEFLSMQECANVLGVDRSGVSRACKNGKKIKGCEITPML